LGGKNHRVVVIAPLETRDQYHKKTFYGRNWSPSLGSFSVCHFQVSLIF